MEYSDREILELIRNGNDNPALSFLYKKVLPKVKHFIKGNNGDDDESYDIFQDAIMIFYKQVKLEKFKEEHEIAGFIYSISRNLWINRVKKKSRTISYSGEMPVVEVSETVLEDLITEEREALIMKVLGDLGDRCKELLLYSIFHKFSMKEICEKMGFSTENAAKTRNYKCKQRLIELTKDNQSIKDLLK